MRIFNNDGSEAEMCGNGIRCFSKYVYEHDIVKKNEIEIETLKGILTAKLTVENDLVKLVQIDMGPPILKCEDVPVISIKEQEQCVEEPISVWDKEFIFTGVSMGNPHAIIFVEKQLNDEDLDDKETKRLKCSIENYIKKAESCLENFTDECHDTLSRKAQNLVEVKFKDYRDHYNKTHKQ